MDRVLSRCLRRLSQLHIHQDRAPEKERTGDRCYLSAQYIYLRFDKEDSPMMLPKDGVKLPKKVVENSKECGEKCTAATSKLAIQRLQMPVLIYTDHFHDGLSPNSLEPP